jgi:hypothetical protein
MTVIYKLVSRASAPFKEYLKTAPIYVGMQPLPIQGVYYGRNDNIGAVLRSIKVRPVEELQVSYSKTTESSGRRHVKRASAKSQNVGKQTISKIRRGKNQKRVKGRFSK